MRVLHHHQPAGARRPGFTLVETVIGLATLTLFTLACFQGILLSRVAHTKAKEEAIAMDFLMHYVETLKGLPFAEVRAGQAINPLFDGVAGAPNLRLPTSDAWIDLATADYEAFHPDLLWLEGRSPQLQVSLQTQSVSGQEHTRLLRVTIAWDAPLRRGGRLTSELTLVRVKDL